MKCKAKSCNKHLIKGDFFTDYDGAFIVPVMFAPTFREVAKLYIKQITGGSTYTENTGEKPSEAFEIKSLSLTHLDFDEDRPNDHTFGKVECWTDTP